MKTIEEKKTGMNRGRRLTRTTGIALLSLLCSRGLAQGSAGTGGGAEPRFLIDIPTAGMPAQGTLALDVDFFQDGGLLLGAGFGLLSRFSLGISYGGSQLIGDRTAVFNPFPGVNARLRPFEEGRIIPALVLGFDSQGKDGYRDDIDQYEVRSKGFFLSASKNFDLAGYFSLHGGLNYSLEGSSGERGIDYFAGVEKTVGSFISLVLEFNGDRNKKSNGDLNFGIRCSVGGGFTLGLDLKDLTRNDGKVSIGNRSVKIEFLKPL